MVGEQDAKKDGRFSACIRPKPEPNVMNFAGIQGLCRFDDSLFELRLIYKAGGNVGHVLQLSREGELDLIWFEPVWIPVWPQQPELAMRIVGQQPLVLLWPQVMHPDYA